VNELLLLADLIIAGSQRLVAIAPIYRAMRAEGRTKLTPEEWDTILAADDSADAKLAADIARAKSEGR
jgi:hypothetical protein